MTAPEERKVFLTIATPFSSRLYCLDAWLAALDDQTIDKSECALLWFVNAADTDFTARIQAEGEKRRSEWAAVTVVGDATLVTAETKSAMGKDAQVAYCWQQLRKLVQTPFVWCLESDVLPDPKAGVLLYNTLQYNSQYGAASAAVPYRHYDNLHVGVMAWDITPPDSKPAPLPGMSAGQGWSVRYHQPRRSWGMDAVDGTGLACLMVRRQVFLDTPLGSSRMPHLGFDQSFCVDMRSQGWQIALVWDVQCEHYQELPSGEQVRTAVPPTSLVDVIIPCWGDYAKFLPRALDSLMRQSRKDCIASITVVGPPRQEQVQAACGQYEGVSFLEVEIPGNPLGHQLSITRNAAAAKGSAPFLLFLDADDELPSRYLQRQLDQLERYEWAAFAIPSVLTFEGDDDFVPALTAAPSTIVGEPFLSVPIVACMMRRSAFEAVGGFPMGPAETWELYVRMYQEGFHPIYCPACPPYRLRHHGDSLTLKPSWTDTVEHIKATYPRAFRRPALKNFVLLQNDNSFRRGGDAVQFEQTREALWARHWGADVRRGQVSVSGYPLVHIFGLAGEWSLPLVQNATNQDRASVVSSIYHRRDSRTAREAARLARYIIAASEGERRAILEDLQDFETKIVVIPHGVHPAFLSSAAPPCTDLPKNYLLCVGRFEENKGQARLLEAIKGLDFPVVLIGGPGHDGDTSYRERCRAMAGPNVTLLDPVPYLEMPAIYDGARAVACVSTHESYGLSLLEGQAAGCNLVLSTGSLAWENWKEFGSACDPSDPASIRAAVTTEMGRERTPKPVPHTWDQVAAQLIESYGEIVSPWR